MGSKKLEVLCPCCEPEVSLTDMVKGLEGQKKEQQNMFKKHSENLKERDRVLDEIFKESQKHVDKSDEKPLRDFDFDWSVRKS